MTQTTNRLAGMVKTKNREEIFSSPAITKAPDSTGKLRVNFMIDVPLLDKIDKHAKQRGISRSAMISTMASELP